MPAGFVIIQSLSIGKDTLGVMQYRQMSGRAGRAGQTDRGVSVLLVRHFELQNAVKLLSESYPRVLSQLSLDIDGGNALLKATIDAIGLQICQTTNDVHEFVSKTLLYHQKLVDNKESSFNGSISSFCLDYLTTSRIVNLDSNNNTISLTKFGKAILKCSLDPDEAVVIYDNLMQAREGLILDVSIHIMYLIAPFDNSRAQFYPDFKKLLTAYDKSNQTTERRFARVFEAVGIDYGTIAKWSITPPSKAAMDTCFDREKLRTLIENSTNISSIKSNVGNMTDEGWKILCRCKRLWIAGIMSKMAEAIQSMDIIAKEFNCEVRDLESLRYATIMMAAKVKRFCNEIGWAPLGRLIENFKNNSLISNTVEEIRHLLQLRILNEKAAKILYDAGIATIEELSVRSVDEILRHFTLADSFEPGVSSKDYIGLSQSKTLGAG